MKEWDDIQERLDHIDKVSRQYEMNTILNAIDILWANHPEFRFGQLLSDFVFSNPDQMFYQEDDLTNAKLFQAVHAENE